MSAHTHTSDRRGFLKLSARLAALGLTTLGAGRAHTALAAADDLIEVDDYKALVCIYMFGGNDANNLIVPLEPTRYAAYQNIRGGLTLGASKLLAPIADASGNSYALHYGLAELNPLYASGNLAVVLNTGLLTRPLTRAQYLQGLEAPTNLFSHSDQTVQAQTGMPTLNGTGWGGRLLDLFGGADSLAAVSLSSPALFLRGNQVSGNAIPPGGTLQLAGMSFWPQQEATARRQAVLDLLTFDGGNTLRQTANQALADGLQLAESLKAAAGGAMTASFPGTPIGNQLREVAKLILHRAAQGPGRQVFFCAIDGFDTHSAQDWQHWFLLSSLSQALGAFYSVVKDAGLASNVTAFTQSEFGRTLQPSGSGSDHAWGSHQLVLGGGVKGGIYGQMPAFALGGPDDAGNRGVWIPTIATSQFGATIGRWFGASEGDLAWAFPDLAQFPTSDAGFMHPA
ncbi:MAG: DUF1501 domain-containing protein [Acidimicrobiia bacterium]|nr:DUF1501 domain-containing protein [Acidimicrobiia bacterium]